MLEEDCSRMGRELLAAHAQISALEERACAAEARAACKDIDRSTEALHLNATADASNISLSGVSAAYQATASQMRSVGVGSPMRMNGRAVSLANVTGTPGRGTAYGGHEELDISEDMVTNNLDSTAFVLSHMPHGGNTLAKKEIRKLSARIARYAKELEAAQAEVLQLRALQRTHAIALRQNKDAARRVFISNQSQTKAQSSYDAEVSAHAATQQELALIRGEIGLLHDAAARSGEQVKVLEEQLIAAQQQIEHYEVLVKHEHKLNRFVRKHVRADPMQNSKLKGKATELKGADFSHVSHQNHKPTTFRQALRNLEQHNQLDLMQRTEREARQVKARQTTVDTAVNDIRAACVFKAPDVLPYLRALAEALHHERAAWTSYADVNKI